VDQIVAAARRAAEPQQADVLQMNEKPDRGDQRCELWRVCATGDKATRSIITVEQPQIPRRGSDREQAEEQAGRAGCKGPRPNVP